MRLVFVFSFMVLIIVQSCKKKEKIDNTSRNIIQNYLNNDSIIGKDTSSKIYSILRAFYNNDSTFLKNLYDKELEQQSMMSRLNVAESCIKNEKISKLGYDEVYRFIFTMAFCPYKVSVIVKNSKIKSVLYFIIYEYDIWKNHCKIVDEFEKEINVPSWERFKTEMEDADYWGLKSYNNQDGVDGHSITVEGYMKGGDYKNNKDLYQYVYRWGNSTLKKPLDFLLKISGNTKGCYLVK